MKYLPFLIICLLFTACKVDESDCTGDDLINTQTILGSWEEIPPSGIIEFAYKYWEIEFTNDAFFATITHGTDAADPTDPCDQFTYKEYITGTYQLQFASLVLNGNYTDQNFNILSPNPSYCYNIGAFETFFIARITCGGILKMEQHNGNQVAQDSFTMRKQ